MQLHTYLHGQAPTPKGMLSNLCLCTAPLLQAVTALQSNTTKRCAQHWKAWVDRKADWRAFQARASQHMAVIRCVLGA